MDVRDYSSEEKDTRFAGATPSSADLRDVSIFEAAYDEYAPKLLRHAMFRTNSPTEAQDIVSQVFLKTWEYVRDPKNRIKDIRGFLYQLTNNLVVDYYRKRSRATFVSYEAVKPYLEVQQVVYPFGALEAKFELEKVWEQFSQLRDEYRTVLVWRYIDELELKEIAVLLGKSKGATAVTLFRALNTLRQLVSEQENA